MSEAFKEKTGTELVRRASIEELEGHRNRALELYAQAFDCIQAANRAAGLACPSNQYAASLDSNVVRLLAHELDGVSRLRWVEECQKNLDADCWQHIIIATGLGDLMDSKAKDQFNEQLSKAPPSFITDNVVATCLTLAGQGAEIFERSVVTVFECLSHRFRRHDAFKFKEHIIMPDALWMSRTFNYGNKTDQKVRDLERAFFILDGRKPPDRQASAAAMVTTALSQGLTTCDTPYLSFKWYRNGNLHIQLKRKDLRDAANQIIAKHRGLTIAASVPKRRYRA